ncbi:glycoside hydrolase family 5 protein [Tardisphaera miroshnichenkoae]
MKGMAVLGRRVLASLIFALVVMGSFDISSSTLLRQSPPMWSAPTHVSLPWVSVSGRYFVYSNGSYATFHGCDQNGFELGEVPSDSQGWEFYATVFKNMADAGFNLVRFPVAWYYIEPQPGEFNESYVDAVKQIVNMANDQGLYVIIDMHQAGWSPVFRKLIASWANGLPVWAVPYRQQSYNALNKDYAYFWSNTTVEQEFASMWEYVASQFANDSGVLGYDLFNEPTTPTNWTSQQMYQNMARVYDMVISAIRKVDQRHIIFFETSSADRGVHEQYWVEPIDPEHQLVIELHDYEVPASNPTLYVALNASLRWHIPLFVGEFGDTSDPTVMSSAASVFDSYGLSWCYWNYWSAEYALVQPYVTLSSAPLLSISQEEYGSDVVVKVNISQPSGWAELFIPEGFELLNGSAQFNPATRCYNASVHDGVAYVRLSTINSVSSSWTPLILVIVVLFMVAVLAIALLHRSRRRRLRYRASGASRFATGTCPLFLDLLQQAQSRQGLAFFIEER